jgi:hypothetical protein
MIVVLYVMQLQEMDSVDASASQVTFGITVTQSVFAVSVGAIMMETNVFYAAHFPLVCKPTALPAPVLISITELIASTHPSYLAMMPQYQLAQQEVRCNQIHTSELV